MQKVYNVKEKPNLKQSKNSMFVQMCIEEA